MTKGFRYISEETLAYRPFYSVITNKGKDHRKNVIRSGTYPTKEMAKTEALKIAQKYDMNVRVFNLRNRRK